MPDQFIGFRFNFIDCLSILCFVSSWADRLPCPSLAAAASFIAASVVTCLDGRLDTVAFSSRSKLRTLLSAPVEAAPFLPVASRYGCSDVCDVKHRFERPGPYHRVIVLTCHWECLAIEADFDLLTYFCLFAQHLRVCGGTAGRPRVNLVPWLHRRAPFAWKFIYSPFLFLHASTVRLRRLHRRAFAPLVFIYTICGIWESPLWIVISNS